MGVFFLALGWVFWNPGGGSHGSTAHAICKPAELVTCVCHQSLLLVSCEGEIGPTAAHTWGGQGVPYRTVWSRNWRQPWASSSKIPWVPRPCLWNHSALWNYNIGSVRGVTASKISEKCLQGHFPMTLMEIIPGFFLFLLKDLLGYILGIFTQTFHFSLYNLSRRKFSSSSDSASFLL